MYNGEVIIIMIVMIVSIMMIVIIMKDKYDGDGDVKLRSCGVHMSNRL